MSNSPSPNWHRTIDVAFDALRAVTLLPGRYSLPGSRRSRLSGVVTACLEDPVGDVPLSQRLAVAKKVVLVLPPPSEPVSTDLVEAVWAHLDAWMAEDAIISVLVARGSTDCHEVGSVIECPHVAVLVRAGVTVSAHTEDRCFASPTALAAAPGVPLVLHELLHEADLILCVSRLALRPDSGVRSPSELLARGCSGEGTRICIERLASTVRAGDCIGRPEELALTRLQNLVCRRMKGVFAIVEAAGADSTAHVAGNPEDVMRLLLGRRDASMFVNMSQHSGAIVVADDHVRDFASASIDVVLLALQQQPPLLAHAPILIVLPDGCAEWTDAATAPAFLHGMRSPMARRPAISAADFAGRRLSESLSLAASAHPIFVAARHLPVLSDVAGLSMFSTLESALDAFRRAADRIEDNLADPYGVLILQGAQYQLPQLGLETFLTSSVQRGDP